MNVGVAGGGGGWGLGVFSLMPVALDSSLSDAHVGLRQQLARPLTHHTKVTSYKILM